MNTETIASLQSALASLKVIQAEKQKALDDARLTFYPLHSASMAADNAVLECEKKLKLLKEATLEKIVDALFKSRPDFPIPRRHRRLTNEEKNACARFRQFGWHISAVSRKLGISYPTVYAHQDYVGLPTPGETVDTVWSDAVLLAQADKETPKVAQCEPFVHQLQHQVY